MSGAYINVVLIAACTVVLAGQAYQGGLRGAIRDADGLVPGADVVLLNEATSLTRAAISNAAGEYAFPNLPPGTYTVRVSMTGFKTFESRGLRVGTQEFLTVDVRLEVGEVQEAITVSGETPVIDTTTASVGTLLERDTLEHLPNVGRNPFVISTIAPNVIPTGVPQFTRMQDQNATAMLSLGGGPRRANNFLLDGVPITDLFNRAAIIPSIEAVEEVKVQVSTYDAELGRTAGGAFNTTHKSGSNAFHGSGFFLDRPEWGTGKLFFTKKSGDPKPDTYYRVWGGSYGGPLIRNRTFFWASTEGYKTQTTANTVLTLPTERERRGDYSQSFNASGQLIVIYDPLTTRPDPARPGQFVRDPFPGNVIPADRINPVARNLTSLLPLPTAGQSLPRTSLPIADFTNQATVKIDHRVSARQTSTGTFAWYHSKEPAPQFLGIPGDPNAVFQPRTVNVLALNHLVVASDRTVLAFRYGYLHFRDDFASVPSDPTTLGFSPAFTSAITGFPRINVAAYGTGGVLLDGGVLTNSTSYSHSANASISHLTGRHTIKAGGEYRLIGMRVFAPGATTGTFTFTSAFTQGPNPNAGGSVAGDAYASFLLGYPAGGNFNIGTANDFYTRYVGGFAQDDFRLGSNVSLNAGIRYEFEQGLSERNDAFTVGFDRDRAFPMQIPGFDLTGGLMYAGIDGYPSHQGNPGTRNFGPRFGAAWSIEPRTVLRGGYGLYWAPSQIAQAFDQAALGTRGFTASTTYVASEDGGFTPCPTCSLTDPFPRGLEQPQGAAQGLATGVGGDVDFVDQSARSAYVHQFSVDLKRELPGRVAATIGYLGSRSERLTLGGTFDSTGRININQLDPQFQSLGPALQELVPNPFFGLAAFGALASSPTIERGQLLRPYPQFRNVYAHRVADARSRYDALTLAIDRRHAGGWDGRVNYVYSVRKDNQIGETNAYSFNAQGAIDNFDLDREFGYSLLDAPHRLNISGTVELPFGTGRRWLADSGLLTAVLGGWSVSAVGSYQSGFPIAILQANNTSNLLGSLQRPNIVPGVDPQLSRDPEADYDPTCACIRWLNPAAWSNAAPFTFGDAPHADPRVRTPFRRNWDLAFEKVHPMAATRLTIRIEVINVFDDPAFTGPRPPFGSPVFGQISSVNGFPRTLQLMARVAW